MNVQYYARIVIAVSVPLLCLTLTFSQTTSKNDPVAKEFKRLVALQAALKKIPYDDYDKEPHKSFLKWNENETNYSDPSAEYYVRSELFWDLYEKNRAHPIAEQIAWTAAKNPLPGECEGYLNCYLYVLNARWGKYLSIYPKGRYSLDALNLLGQALSPMVGDRVKRAVYGGPTDASDRAELQKLLAELEATVSRTSGTRGAKVRGQVKLLREAHR